MKISRIGLSIAILGACFAAPLLASACTVAAADCPSGQTCNASGVCVQNSPISCSVSNPCPSGQTCNGSGVCVQNSPAGTTLINPLGDRATLNSFVVSILDLVIKIGSVVIVLMIVYIGFLFVKARGNESELTTAKTALLWTIIGALILLGAKAIAMGIQATVQAISTGN